MAQGTTPPADPDAGSTPVTTPPQDSAHADGGDDAATDSGKHAASGAPAGSNTALPTDHDRVAMLSMKADGTPDQTNPEFIDPAAALAATTEQFAQQAVSAADVATAAELRGTDTVDDSEQDPTVAALAEAHEAAQSDAKAAAERAVEDLTR